MQCADCGAEIDEFAGRWFGENPGKGNWARKCYPYHRPRELDLAEIRKDKTEKKFLEAKREYEDALAEYLSCKHPETEGLR